MSPEDGRGCSGDGGDVRGGGGGAKSGEAGGEPCRGGSRPSGRDKTWTDRSDVVAAATAVGG